MAFCSNCGKPLADGAKFCAECGAPAASAENDGSKRVQKFVGEIRKCPNCGQEIGSFQGKCPACGFEFRGAKAAKSTTDFAALYAKVEGEQKQLDWIKNFPIPNTKEDLLEFAILARGQVISHAKAAAAQWKSAKTEHWGMSPRAFHELQLQQGKIKNYSGIEQDDFFFAWQQKFNAVMQKARLTFASDTDTLAKFSALEAEVDAAAKELEKAKKSRAWGLYTILVGIPLVVIALFFMEMHYISNSTAKEEETKRLELLMTEIQTEIDAENYDSAEMKLADLVFKKSSKEDREIWQKRHELLQNQTICCVYSLQKTWI